MKPKGKKRLSKAFALFMTVLMLMSMMSQVAFADTVQTDGTLIQQEQQLDVEKQNTEGIADPEIQQDQQPDAEEQNTTGTDEGDLQGNNDRKRDEVVKEELQGSDDQNPDEVVKEELQNKMSSKMSSKSLTASKEAEMENVSGTVYMSVSYDGKYIDGCNGSPMAYMPVDMNKLAEIDLNEYDLAEYLYDEDDDGEYEVTALQLVIYAHEKLYGGSWNDVTFTGSPGSSYFAGGVFGFDENLNYYLNGEYPLANAGWGATSDQIVLDGGDYIDLAGFSSWNFYSDSNYGFHFFENEQGSFTHSYVAEEGTAFPVKLVRSYSGMGNGAIVYDESDYTIYYGTAYGRETGSVTTDSSGCAEITFPSDGTWYLWCDGGYGLEFPNDIVSSPAYATVTVTAVEEPEPAPTGKGTVYISASHDEMFLDDVNGDLVAYTAVNLGNLDSIDLNKYGLSDYLYDKDNDGINEITALHLYIYVHENIFGGDWNNDVRVTGSPGSIYFAEGLFGHEDENLRYNYNGAYPANEDGWGTTADQLVLSDGDFLEVAHFTNWMFYADSAYGFHYFVDDSEDVTLTYEAEAGSPLSVKLQLTGGGMGMGDATTYEAGYTIYYGNNIGNAEGSVTTDDNGIASITFSDTGTYYIWCEGGQGIDAAYGEIVSAPASATVTVTAGTVAEPEPAEPIDVYVTLADEGEIVMAKKMISVTDRDKSGDFNVDEVLYAAHETGYSGGAGAGYNTAVNDFGLHITKLWGNESGNYGYWLNDVSCWSLADNVKNGDSLSAFIYQNTDVRDSYSKFGQSNYVALAETYKTLSLQKAGYDASWNAVFSSHKGATLKIYNSDFEELDANLYNVTDNDDGTYSVAVKEIGSYYVAAYDNNTPIVPAICELIVTENSDVEPANEVEKKINAIGEVTIDSEGAIKEARVAYDELTDTQKALVENYNVLEAAEATLIELKSVAAADEAAAAAVDVLIDAIGEVTIHSGESIEAAREAYDKLSEVQKGLVTKYDELVAAENTIAELYKVAASVDHKAIYDITGQYLEELGTPSVGSTGGEWMVIDITRAGGVCPEGYYDNVVKYVKENINDKERLHSSKSTDNSRVILGLTSAGYDVTNVAGHNLLEGLTDMSYVKKQGINGPIWALIAFDSHDYEIPEGGDVSREKLIETILAAQHTDGGWSLSAAVGSPSDPDMTGMAIQALAPYYDKNDEVKTAVDEALGFLSETQHANGGFGSIDGKCTESCAQVIVALTALGINPEEDDRFIKNGMSAVDAMCLFAVEGGGFAHVPNGKLNGMATEQGQYALAAYFRMISGQTSLYDMSDVKITSGSDDSQTGSNDNQGDNNDQRTEAKDDVHKNEGNNNDQVADVKDDDHKNEGKDSQKNNKGKRAITKSASIKLNNSGTEKKATKEELEKGKENHYDKATGVDARDNSNDILPWYIKLNVVKQEATDEQKAAVSEALGGEGEIFILMDIHFTNTKDGSEWQPTKPIKIKMPMVDIGDYEHAVIVHITDKGKIELINGTVDGDMIEFEADSFSLYGIVGTNVSINDLLTVEDDSAVIWPWILISIIALTAIVYLSYRRKREA